VGFFGATILKYSMTTTISESSIEFYDSLYRKRRGWLPIKPNQKPSIVPGSEITLQRALSLSKLELPVGNWIAQELAKNPGIPSSLIKLLEANIDDETNHDIALNNIRAIFPVHADFDLQVDGFIKRADELANLYSPVVVSAVLESSVFFVILPIFRFLGGSAMRTTANDISNDENLHVSTNVQLCKDLGYRRGKALDAFRKDIIQYLVTDLTPENDNKYLSANFWHSTSNSLYHQGKANGLADTKRAVMPAFFETASNNLPIYN
jgi:hypothetical protein